MSAPIRVAQVLNRMESGGVEAVVMNYYRHIDREKVQFDFYFYEASAFPQRRELEQLGAGIYPIPAYSHPAAYHQALYRAFKSRRYPIVHAHLSTMSVFALFAAWRAGVPVRICHNHSTAHWGEGKRTLLKYLLRPFNKLFATEYFACGETAGRWMFGGRCFDRGRVRVMPNAIETETFAFDPDAACSHHDHAHAHGENLCDFCLIIAGHRYMRVRLSSIQMQFRTCCPKPGPLGPNNLLCTKR